MSGEPDAQGPVAGQAWPYCPALRRTCLVVGLMEAMGQNVLDTLVTFVKGAEDGSRLTLQKNRDGLTTQVTWAVQKGHSGGQLDIAGLRILREKLDSMNVPSSSS